MQVKVWRKGNICALVAEMWIGAATMENSMKGPQKLKIKLPYDPVIPHLCIYLKKKMKILSWKYICIPMFIVASLRAQLVKNPSAMQETLVRFLGREDAPGEGIGYPLQYSWSSLVAQLLKESACNVGDLGLIPGLGRYPGEGKGYPIQYSGPENSMDPKSRTQLSDFHFTSL